MKTYYIFEHWAQCTLKGSQELRSTNGYQFFDTIEAESESQAIEKWLTRFSDNYDIISYDRDLIAEIDDPSLKENAWYGCASGSLVWEESDTVARFGDFEVLAFTEPEVKERVELIKAAKL